MTVAEFILILGEDPVNLDREIGFFDTDARDARRQSTLVVDNRYPLPQRLPGVGAVRYAWVNLKAKRPE